MFANSLSKLCACWHVMYYAYNVSHHCPLKLAVVGKPMPIYLDSILWIALLADSIS